MTHFLVTVDTEEDNQWECASSYSLDNVSSLARFQDLCNSYEVIPTYLVTYSVVSSGMASDLICRLAASGKCEIGAHLHPWFNPPYEPPSVYAACPHTYPLECSYSNLKDKLQRLTDRIYQVAQVRPRTYRAGRYGLDGANVRILEELGYWADTSITPFSDWSKHPGTTRGGPDFRNAPCQPYFLNPDNVSQPEPAGHILEVPITIRKTADASEQVWLRPYPWFEIADLVGLCKSEICSKGRVLNLMLHSSELMVGGSPVTRSPQDLDAVYEKLEAVFAFVRKMKLPRLSVSDLYKQFVSGDM